MLRDLLSPTGSIVIELGNGWDAGQPTVSTLAIEALLEFKRRGDLFLCQEFICFNPARLPGPAQWVTVERCRVKDAFTRVWWMATTPRPKADNRRVLTQYSDSMRQLLRRGTYNPGIRPSEHNIGAKSFLSNNGGAIPPNVIAPSLSDLANDPEWMTSFLCEVLPIPNTHTMDPYQRACRQLGARQHPARMPARLVEFFVDFLTDENDLVLDPFAGSNTTGFVAQARGRRWIAVEADEVYAATSECRFVPLGQRVSLGPSTGSPRTDAQTAASRTPGTRGFDGSRRQVSAVRRRQARA